MLGCRLDELDLVTFRRVDESDFTATRRGMWSVAQRISLGGGFLRKCFQISDFEGKMSQVGADQHRATFVEFANFNLFAAARSFEEN